MGQLGKAYVPRDIEARWYERWVAEGVFEADSDDDRDTYVIMIPPPNVTGILHIGHVLNNTIQDVLIRWQRLKGKNVLWLPGTDHAGIATQNKVKQALRDEGIDAEELGRERFVERCWKWREEKGGAIIRQLRDLGCSLDWSRERFTLDDALSAAVREVFLRLYDEGLIYRGDYLVNWCTECGSALSDEEVEHRDVGGSLWYLNYPLSDGSGHVTVATTRPETMLGDQAVAVNPGDDRYRELVGKSVRLPIVEREIPIIADDWVDPEFGTGAVKVTPGHDPNDFEIARRHELTVLSVLDGRGMTTGAAGPLAELPREEARARVVGRFEDAGLLEKIETHEHAVGHCYRDGSVVEPLVSRQWFVKTKPLAEPAIEAVRKGEVEFFPGRWSKTYFHWMGNIRDWCISRQLWWGHRIPIWYCGACGEEHREEETTRCKSCGHETFQQDPDVLDTWFSSWLWPFSTLGWPKKTRDLDVFYPGDALVTGPDIIFFWVARMIMAGLKFAGGVPFRDVYLHGIVRDDSRRKMSKTLGNSPDPLEIMAKTGADALRFTMIYLTPKDGDIAFAEKKVETGSFFANKLWQVSRFALSHIGETVPAALPDGKGTVADRWIRSRFASVSDEVERHLRGYEFSDAAHLLYDFLWHEFCDWYVEMAKTHLEGDDEPARDSTRATLLEVLSGTLRLLHPFMPFITEEIWSHLPGERDLIARSEWPAARRNARDGMAESRMRTLQGIIGAIRNIRSELNVPPQRKATVTIRASEDVSKRLDSARDYVAFLARADEICLGPDVAPESPSAAAVVDGVEVFVHLLGLVDVDAETDRLSKELEKLTNAYQSTFKKLNNRDFLDRAPKEVIDRERSRLERIEVDRDKLSRNLGVLTESREE